MTQADRVHSTPPTNTSALPVDPTRRGFLAQAAVAAAGGAALGMTLPLPGSAGAAERVPDPIHALIEQHRAAYAAWSAAVATECRLEEEISMDLRRTCRTQWDETIVETDDPRWIASEKHYRQTWNQQDAIAWEIATVPANTLAGIVALMTYVVECEHQYDIEFWPQLQIENNHNDTWLCVFHRNLAGALVALVDGVQA
jgi:hypothetical protein